MKKVPFYITIFIFAVIGALAAVAAVYPEQGISVGELTLNFPTLQSVLSDPSETNTDAPSPEELLAQRAEQMRIEEEEAFLSFFRENPASIQWPNLADNNLPVWGEDNTPNPAANSIGNFRYFDNFYDALNHADSIPVRVVHYGDSQIEEDRISCVLRRELQSQFTGNGVGTVPLYQSVQSLTMSQSTSYEPTRHMVFGPKSLRREGSRKYGMMGQVAILDTTITVSFLPRTKQTGYYSAHYASQLQLFVNPDSRLRLNGSKLSNEQRTNLSPTLSVISYNLPDSTTSLSFSLSGKADVYGISLQNTTGVNVDNFAMRGCSGTIFRGIDRQQLAGYFQHTNAQLIILQFGGNSMPYIKTEAQVDKYIQTLVEQVQYMQSLAPNAAFLFIGPSDMTTRIQGRMQTYPILPLFDQKLSDALTQQGIAYWSLFNAMGGTGAMQQWVHSGYAGSDYIHFTRKGANEVGQLLYNAILTGYNYYQWRLKQETPVINLHTQPDTVAIKQPTTNK